MKEIREGTAKNQLTEKLLNKSADREGTTTKPADISRGEGNTEMNLEGCLSGGAVSRE